MKFTNWHDEMSIKQRTKNKSKHWHQSNSSNKLTESHLPFKQSNSSWYTLSGSNEPLPVLSSSRVRLLGPILAIEAVTSEDAGNYKCTVANAGGEANAELRLTVSTPLHVEIVPNVMSVNMGATAEFRCVVSSNGMPMVSHHHITWIKVSGELFRDFLNVPPGACTGSFLIKFLRPSDTNTHLSLSNRTDDNCQCLARWETRCWWLALDEKIRACTSAWCAGRKETHSKQWQSFSSEVRWIFLYILAVEWFVRKENLKLDLVSSCRQILEMGSNLT